MLNILFSNNTVTWPINGICIFLLLWIGVHWATPPISWVGVVFGALQSGAVVAVAVDLWIDRRKGTSKRRSGKILTGEAFRSAWRFEVFVVALSASITGAALTWWACQ